MKIIDNFDDPTNQDDKSFDSVLTKIYGLCEEHKNSLTDDMTAIVKTMCIELGLDAEDVLIKIVDGG
jgi:hypothetical protein